MAKIIRRQRKTDGGISYTVTFIEGGGRSGARPTRSQTFKAERDALAFKAAVELSGNHFPPGWVPGHGYVSTPAELKRLRTFDSVFQEWAEYDKQKALMRAKKPHSSARDHRTYELHIKPTFGDRPFAEISRAEVRGWLAAQAAAGASAKSIANRHGLLSQIMNWGKLELELRPDNPCEGNKLPRVRVDKQVTFFTHREWGLLRSCFRPDVHLLVDVLLSTGARWGEVSALRVGDVTASTSEEGVLHLHIVRSWSQRAPHGFDNSRIRTEEGESNKWILGPPKSGRGRWVSLRDDVARALASEIEGRGADEYVFRIAAGNPWRYDNFHENRWTPAITMAKQHGLTKHGKVHMLRHTAAVWSIADGLELHRVSEMLGHSSIQTTYDIYGGLLNLHDAAMSQTMAKQLLLASDAARTISTPEPHEVLAVRVRTRPRVGRSAQACTVVPAQPSG